MCFRGSYVMAELIRLLILMIKYSRGSTLYKGRVELRIGAPSAVTRQPLTSAHSRYTHLPRETEQTDGGATMGVKVRQWKDAWWVFVDHKQRRKAKRIGSGQASLRPQRK
jgi:hypothetical protein